MENISKIKNIVESELSSQKISGRFLLDRFCVIDELSRKTAAYADHKYTPFYYYLGKHLQPSSLMEIGFSLGLVSSCFLLSCKTVSRFYGFKETSDGFFSMRMGKANIKKVMKKEKEKSFYVGGLYDKEFINQCKQKWDMVIFNEEEEQNYDKKLQYLETIWPHVNDNGIIVIEHLSSQKAMKLAFLNFCSSKNKEGIIFDTRYGTGVIQK